MDRTRQFAALVLTLGLLVAAGGLAATAARAASWYEGNPTYIDPRDDTPDWLFSAPGDQGMEPARLRAGAGSLARNHSVLSFLVLRHGRIVLERYYHGSARDKSNNVHSASKSILQALVAIAIDQGYIGSWDDRVTAYLPECLEGASPVKRTMTIRDLMTMSSGLSWTEDKTEYAIQKKRDWVRAVLARRLLHRPGARFNYSTGNTHVVSALLQRATGMRTSEFARLCLLDPLGITAEHWGHDPQGVDSGGYNVYLTPRELAKFGLLYAQGGVWKGEQVVPAAAVDQAATRVWRVDALFNYATGWWQRRLSGHDMFFCWGWGGQFVYVIPDLDVVMVTTEDTADWRHNVEIDSRLLLRRYVIPSITRAFAVQLPRTVTVGEGRTWRCGGRFHDRYGQSWSATVDYRRGAGPQTLALGADKNFSLRQTWPDEGRRDLRVVVTNQRGETARALARVNVVNVAPRVRAGGRACLRDGARLTRCCSFSDPGTDRWRGWVDYGDGSARRTLRLRADKTLILSHRYPSGRGRRFTVTLRVTDGDGGRGIARFAVAIR